MQSEYLSNYVLRYCRDYIFEWRERKCTKAHFQSLKENGQVESTVIDTWTSMLNENELLRADSSPLRMFLTSETIVSLHSRIPICCQRSLLFHKNLMSSVLMHMQYGPMLMNVAKGDVDARLNRYAAFDDNMEVVLQLVNEIHGRMFDVNDFEMVKF